MRRAAILILMGLAALAAGCVMLTEAELAERARLVDEYKLAVADAKAAWARVRNLEDEAEALKTEIKNLQDAVKDGIDVEKAKAAIAGAQEQLAIMVSEVKLAIQDAKNAEARVEKAWADTKVLDKQIDQRLDSEGIAASSTARRIGIGLGPYATALAAIYAWWKKWQAERDKARRERELGVLSRAAVRLEDDADEAKTFGEAVMAELTASGVTTNEMRAVKRDAAAGNL